MYDDYCELCYCYVLVQSMFRNMLLTHMWIGSVISINSLHTVYHHHHHDHHHHHKNHHHHHHHQHPCFNCHYCHGPCHYSHICVYQSCPFHCSTAKITMANILRSRCSDVYIPTHMTLTEFITRQSVGYEDAVAFVSCLTSGASIYIYIYIYHFFSSPKYL